MKFTSIVFVITLTFMCKSISMGTIKPSVNPFDTNSHTETMHPEFRNSLHAKLNRPEELSTNFWFNNGKDFVTKQLNRSTSQKPAKNIILFIGDGMSLTTLAAARVYKGGEEKSLSFQEFPYVATVKTYCVDYQVPDSACTATAYLSGVKNNYATIGISAKVPLNDCVGQMDKSNHVKSIAKWAMDAGKSAGLVTTTSVLDASPGIIFQ